jgi:hypothetical protein
MVAHTTLPELREPCGYLYSVEVIEAFKGDTGQFSFFWSKAIESASNAGEWLIFVSERGKSETSAASRAISQIVDPTSALQLTCRLSSRFFVPENMPGVFFIASLGKDIGRVVQPASDVGVLWCMSLAGEERSDRVAVSRNTGTASDHMISLSGVRKVLRRFGSWMIIFDRDRMPRC